MNRSKISPFVQALVATLLFGASAPLAKLLLGEIEPVPLAAFLYLGSGIGLLGIRIFQKIIRRPSDREAKITKPDLIWLVGAVLAGGVAAPIILLFSLKNTPAATASLLLNFECVATSIIAVLAFKESITRRVWWAIGLITLSSIFLSINFKASWGVSFGALGILLACVLWGIDNNFTRNISAKDPLVIVTIKGLGAGGLSFALAMILGNKLPAFGIILGAMALGSFSYGVSIVLFIRAMRGLGAARTSALFSAAPLGGMILSFLIFREMPTWTFLIALPIMVIGTIFLVTEQHEHFHTHKFMVHEHAHVHDDGHHDHQHEGGLVAKHSHIHQHEELPHEHEHLPDIHHRHSHSSNDDPAD
jgi:drug/metabolite transporter (DMT)-like permease